MTTACLRHRLAYMVSGYRADCRQPSHHRRHSSPQTRMMSCFLGHLLVHHQWLRQRRFSGLKQTFNANWVCMVICSIQCPTPQHINDIYKCHTLYCVASRAIEKRGRGGGEHIYIIYIYTIYIYISLSLQYLYNISIYTIYLYIQYIYIYIHNISIYTIYIYNIYIYNIDTIYLYIYICIYIYTQYIYICKRKNELNEQDRNTLNICKIDVSAIKGQRQCDRAPYEPFKPWHHLRQLLVLGLMVCQSWFRWSGTARCSQWTLPDFFAEYYDSIWWYCIHYNH